MGTDQQQFCLRWHSYQSSLMATLPQLLDGNHLTDVTLSAQGRNLRAHKVILSACSHYFKELFKELQPLQHPVIVLPGMNFADLVALVTFMYSGEVNIYQHQLSGLLTMADVLHIRGLSEVGSEAGNAGMDSLAPPVSSKRDPKSPTAAKRAKLSTSSPTHVTSPPLDQAADKRSKESALDCALYGKRSWLQALDPNLYTNGNIAQDVAENLATLDSKINASQFQNLNEKMTDLYNQKIGSKKSLSMDRSRNILDDQVFPTVSHKPSGSPIAGLHMAADGYFRVKTEQELVNSVASGEVMKTNSGNGKHILDKDTDDGKGLESPSRLFSENMMEDKMDLSTMQGLDLSQAVGSNNSSNNSTSNNSPSSKSTNASSSGSMSTFHTKLYATCAICGKQLSNQYNLRVHMETHQNVSYACSICSHVSRSKDALRKHVSYRHPAPVDGSGSGGGSGAGGNKRESKKKADQAAAAASANVSSASVSATSTTTSTITTVANSTTASSSVTTTSTNPVTSSDSI
ncbi:hypothetical protein ONE63_009061 [Megalurothrips usitatus]|uniref:Uncharacterized protein n=1 Tax=Megalurothrips usitatus TaxID=439358 RepID=A0AAV7XQ45_9NEOP|nr:hypothetical protein ONE63_009061 [Megalurothrips usitatus]